MTEKRFGEFNQKRFITSVELDNTCGIEDLMKTKKYGGFREKDYHKINKIRDELNKLYYDNEQLQTRNDRQAKQLANLYNLIEKEDWETLKGIIEEFKESDERLQQEYNYEGMLND